MRNPHLAVAKLRLKIDRTVKYYLFGLLWRNLMARQMANILFIPRKLDPVHKDSNLCAFSQETESAYGSRRKGAKISQNC